MSAQRRRIGLVGADAPPELVLAAGAVPVRLGRSTAATDEQRTRAASLLGAIDPAAVELVAGVLVDSSDLLGIVCSRDRDASLRVFYVLRELRARGERLPPVHLVDLVHLRRESTLRYDVAQLERLADVLAGWTGTDPRPALPDAVAAYAGVRELLGRLQLLRAERRVTGTAAHALFDAAATLAPADAAARLTVALAAAAEQAPDQRPALFLSGSAQDDPSLYRMVEGRGWLVTGEDSDRGGLALTIGLDAAAVRDEGLVALARAYRDRGPDSATASAADRAAYTDSAVSAAGAVAVLDHVRRLDEGPLWDLPAVRDRLAARGVPVAQVRDEGLEPDPAALDEALSVLRAGVVAGAAR